MREVQRNRGGRQGARRREARGSQHAC